MYRYLSTRFSLLIFLLFCLPAVVSAQGEKAEKKAEKAFSHEDYEKAVPLFMEAAEAGNTDAIYYLAVCNYSGYGMIRNKLKALELYDQAARLNDARAADYLMWFYRRGADTAINPEQETVYAIIAANIVSREPINTKDPDKNMGKRITLMRAAELLHHIGGSVEEAKKPLPMDTVAFRFAKLAALYGSADGMYYTGKYFQYGIGVEQSNTAAIAWFRQAVANGSDQAQYGLTALTGEKANYSRSDYRYYEEQKKLDLEHPDRNLTKADLPGGYVSKSENDAYIAWWQRTMAQPARTYKQSSTGFQWGTPKTAAQRDQDSYDKMHKEADQREKNYDRKWGR